MYMRMNWLKQSKYENITYLVLWTVLFIAPVLTFYIHTGNMRDEEFQWREVLFVWSEYLPFLGIFLLHNFLLAPLLVYRHQKALYSVVMGSVLVCFMVYQCANRPPEMMHDRPMPPHERPEPQADRHEEMAAFEHHPMEPRHDREEKDHRPPLLMGQHDVIAVIILILMLGMNIGIKLYFKSRKDAKELVELEKKSLEQQLEYLKYQINPHFFMNTLNNIHALVDIDAEKAKHTIVELSKMMRFVLYEGNKKGVPLDREIAFIQHYITLMKLRYTDKVSITVSTPEQMPNKEIPPLLLITFIENAFKHGVSYQQKSYINIAIKVEGDNLHFSCNNSKQAIQEQRPGGVGLTNVKQRLALIYDHNYTLNIKDEADAYHVELTIPLLNDQSTGY